jgi:uncharacterized protein YndB with AHSA1/START domain
VCARHEGTEGTPVFMLRCEATIRAGPADVWAAWTDVSRWPAWDRSKEIARLDGPFAPGTSGWAKQRGNLGGPFTITVVEPETHWTSECPLPFGKVVFDHFIEPQAGGRVKVTKSVEVHGGFGPLFKLMFATKMRNDIDRSFVALERFLLEGSGPSS